MLNNIKELTLEELGQFLIDCRQPRFHARQIFQWIYQKDARGFDQMSNLSLDLRNLLKDNFRFFDLISVRHLESDDGTRKFLLETEDGDIIEAATIPTEKRLTGCVSCQIGCKFACRFCASGVLGFRKNLTSGQILDEVYYLKNCQPGKKLTHVVFMGMGEPFDNYDHVLKAIRAINAPWGFNIGARRITISTCGLIPGIERLSGEGLQIELSVSLHAADDKIRSHLVPINKTYPLRALISACQRYIKKTNRQVTFEYIMLQGINSDIAAAQKLAGLLKGLNCKINLIPANTVKELKLGPPNKPEILLFREHLLKSGINVTLRRSRGEDIEAACGQLRLRYEKK